MSAGNSKIRFLGTTPATLDDRGRLTLPAKLLADLKLATGEEQTEALEVVSGIWENGEITLFPYQLWEELVDQLESRASHDVNAKRALDVVYSTAERQLLDKQSRFKISPEALTQKPLGSDVQLVGRGRYWMIVNKQTRAEQLSKNVNHLAQAEFVPCSTNP